MWNKDGQKIEANLQNINNKRIHIHNKVSGWQFDSMLPWFLSSAWIKVVQNTSLWRWISTACLKMYKLPSTTSYLLPHFTSLHFTDCIDTELTSWLHITSKHDNHNNSLGTHAESMSFNTIRRNTLQINILWTNKNNLFYWLQIK